MSQDYRSFTSNDSPLMFVGHTHFPTKFIRLVIDGNKDSDVDFKFESSQRYMVMRLVGDPRDGHVTAVIVYTI